MARKIKVSSGTRVAQVERMEKSLQHIIIPDKLSR